MRRARKFRSITGLDLLLFTALPVVKQRGLRARIDAELLKDTIEIISDGFGLKPERRRDFLISLACSDRLQNAQLLRGQCFDRALHGRRRTLAQRRHRVARYNRIKNHAVAHNLVNRGDDVARFVVLE